MPTLMVMRHAQAESAPGLRDVDRPLTRIGEMDAAATGHFLRDLKRPGLVMCSTAERAIRTADLVAGQFEPSLTVHRERRIYSNNIDDLIDLIRQTGDDIETVLLIGHNPSVYQLVLDLAGGADEGFPPASIAVIDLGVPWADTAPGTGRLISMRR